jgi:hypothetical protein
MTMKFQATIEINNINPYVLVNAARAKRLKSAWRRPMPVLVQVNGRPEPPWRINMMPVGDGSFYLYLHGDVRKASSTKVGDSAEICVSFDESYSSGSQYDMLPAFAVLLNDDALAKARWEGLAPSRQKEILRYLANLKSEEARHRNVTRAIRVLGGAKAAKRSSR